MMSEEKMQENLNVFLRSSFFVPLLKRMTGQKDELSNEGAGKYQEISREMQRIRTSGTPYTNIRKMI